MKFFISTILSAILLISLSACESSSGGSATKNQSQPETTSKTNNSGTSQPNTSNNTNNSNNTAQSSNTNSSNENKGTEETFYGQWQIKKVIAFAPVGTYSSEDINALIGKQLTFSKSSATCFGDSIVDMNNTVTNPIYKKTVITKNDLQSDYRVTLDQLGLNGDSVTEVEAKDTKGHIIFFITPDNNKLILYGGGTYFELEKVLEQNSSTSTNEDNKNQSTNQENNQNKAVALVEDYLRDKNELIEDKNHFVLFDGMINHYYIVRYSTLVSGHSSTNGRYAVDINTGKVEDVTANPNILNKPSGNEATNQPTGAWVKTFEKELYKGYHVTPSSYKYIGNGNWEVWVKEVDTGQYPYVTVNQNTGNFHG